MDQREDVASSEMWVWHVLATVIPDTPGSSPDTSGQLNPEVLDWNPDIPEINSNPILSLIADAHDDMIMLKLVLEMLHLISRRFPITTNKVFSIWIVTFIFWLLFDFFIKCYKNNYASYSELSIAQLLMFSHGTYPPVRVLDSIWYKFSYFYIFILEFN